MKIDEFLYEQHFFVFKRPRKQKPRRIEWKAKKNMEMCFCVCVCVCVCVFMRAVYDPEFAEPKKSYFASSLA